MTLWPQINELAPTGRILINNHIYPMGELIYHNYSALSTRLTLMARNMVTDDVEIINYNNGDRAYNILYNVQSEDEPHCLNVYGAKMIMDYLEAKEREKQNENRFNYTGLQ